MEDILLDQKIKCLIRQDARINITKKNVGENDCIEATIVGILSRWRMRYSK